MNNNNNDDEGDNLALEKSDLVKKKRTILNNKNYDGNPSDIEQ